MFSDQTKAGLKEFAAKTMDTGRFVRQVGSYVRGKTGDVKTWADELESFSGRLRMLKADEIPLSASKASNQVYLLVAQAGITLANQDRVKDELTQEIYEVLGIASASKAGPTVNQFYVGRVF